MPLAGIGGPQMHVLLTRRGRFHPVPLGVGGAQPWLLR